jgi:hypothetical protein
MSMQWPIGGSHAGLQQLHAIAIDRHASDLSH